MSDLSSDDLRQILGPDWIRPVNSGGAEGHDVRYEADGGAKVENGTAAVSYKLNEPSLKNAEMRAGTDHPLQARSRMDQIITKSYEKQSGSDTKYANSFRGDLKPHNGPKGFSRNHRAHMPSMISADTSFTPTKGPIERHNRQLFSLRNTFNQIARRKHHTTAINLSPEKLPQGALEKMAKKAIQTGAQMTAAGPVSAISRLSGLRQAFKKYEDADLLLPGSVPAMRPRNY